MKNITNAIASLALVMSSACLSAQTTFVSEQFSGATFPPTGWTNVNVSGSSTDDWDFVSIGNNPSASPHSSGAMARFNVYNFSGGTRADLSTGALDFSTVPSVVVGFWMYRDDPGWSSNDYVSVYASTTNTVSSSTSSLLGTVYRYVNNPPNVQSQGWYYYEFNVPSSYNGTVNYIIWEGYANWGLNMYIDDIHVFSPGANDIKMVSLDAPAQPPLCYSNNQQVAVTIMNTGTASQSNIPLGVAISGANTQTLTGTYAGPLAPGASYSYTFATGANMSASGTYGFKAYSGNPGDSNTMNDTLSMQYYDVATTYALPYMQNFNASTSMPPDWSNTIGWVDGMHGKGPSNGFTMEMDWNTNYEVTMPKVGALTANSVIDFDYRLINYAWPYPNPGGTPPTLANDSINLYISTDCGATFTQIYSINASTQNTSNLFATITVPLGAYAGQNVIMKFRGIYDNGDYYFDLDNINIRNMMATDAGATALVSPAPYACFSSSEAIVVNIKNYAFNPQSIIPVTAIVAGPTATQTLNTVFTSTLGSNMSGVAVVGNANMSAPGTYTITVFTSLPGDGASYNDTMQIAYRDVAANLTYEDFNTGTLPLGWQVDNINSNSDFGVHQMFGINPGVGATAGMVCELWGTHNTSQFTIPKLHVTTDTCDLYFQYRIITTNNVSNPGGTPKIYGPNDSLLFEASTNCGTSWMPVYGITDANHITSNNFREVHVCLGSVINNDIMLRVRAVWGGGDYFVAIDSIGLQAPTFTVSNGPLCASGSTVQLVSNPSTGGTFMGPGVSGTTYNVPALGVGTYTVGFAYCTSFKKDTIHIVNPVLTTTVSAAPCSGGTVTIQAGNAGYYTWSNNATTDTIMVAPVSSTVYTVTGTYDNGCTATATPTANIIPNPVININVAPAACTTTMLLPMTATPAGGTFSGIGVVGSDFYPYVVGPGTYTVNYAYTAGTGCSTTQPVLITVLDCTGIDEMESNGFSLSPNPNNGEVIVRLADSKNLHASISVFDAIGKLVLKQELNAMENTINTSELKAGAYFYMISTGESTVIGRGKMIRQ